MQWTVIHNNFNSSIVLAMQMHPNAAQWKDDGNQTAIWVCRRHSERLFFFVMQSSVKYNIWLLLIIMSASSHNLIIVMISLSMTTGQRVHVNIMKEEPGINICASWKISVPVPTSRLDNIRLMYVLLRWANRPYCLIWQLYQLLVRPYNCSRSPAGVQKLMSTCPNLWNWADLYFATLRTSFCLWRSFFTA